MKCGVAFPLVLLGLSSLQINLPVVAMRLAETPVARVVTILNDLKHKIEQDDVAEKESYDKYSCWCEATVAEKTKSISDAEAHIESLEATMKELGAAIASHGAEIKQLEADIAANTAAQSDSKEVRDKENQAYRESRAEYEQCMGSLEAAIKVLTGAGTGKQGFLETLQEAQVVSVAARVRGLLTSATAMRSASNEDLVLVRHFVDKPGDFFGNHGVSTMQTANNPFGDYAPQSGRIQGILKSMYDGFAADLERANVEEAEAQKAYQAFMATKQTELATLQLTLEKQNLAKATKSENLVQATTERDDTKAQLQADENLLADIKAAWKVKGEEWSTRLRLRNQELAGIGEAIQILDSAKSKNIFGNAFSLLQSSTKVEDANHGARGRAYMQLRDLARRFQSVSLAELATKVKTNGHFDEVIASIDAMMALLRKEEQDDIAHRDRCQRAQKKNSNDMEDIGTTIAKSAKALARMTADIDDKTNKINQLELDINGTKEEMAAALEIRNNERAAFEQSLKDDADAVALINQAIQALLKFYKSNKLELLTNVAAQPYSEDPNKPPETIWKGGNYGGQKQESHGIVAILKMIVEDLENEMATSRKDETEAQKMYDENKAAATAVLETQKQSKLTTEKELAAVKGDKVSEEEFKGDQEADLSAEEEMKNALESDCSWVDSHFASRRDKRKAEMSGLTSAKSYLAGVEDGTELGA